MATLSCKEPERRGVFLIDESLPHMLVPQRELELAKEED